MSRYSPKLFSSSEPKFMLDDEDQQTERTDVQPWIDALGYLKSVYNDPMQSTAARMKAASIAIEYERPRLAVTASIESKDFAALLDKARQRIANLDQPREIVENPPTKPIIQIP